MKRYSEKTFFPDASDINHEAYKEGCKHYEKGDFTRARHAFENALEYWPLDPQAWFALGNCFDELNKPARAEKCFRKSLKYSPPEKESDVYYNLGNSLYDQGKLELAIECYVKVTGQSSVYIPAQRNLESVQNELRSRNT